MWALILEVLMCLSSPGTFADFSMTDGTAASFVRSGEVKQQAWIYWGILGLHKGYMGMMEKKMETIGYTLGYIRVI